MKLILVLVFVAVVAARAGDDFSRYENYDISEMTGNDRLMDEYVECFLGSGKCMHEANDMKKLIPQSVQDSCSKCSEEQKGLVGKVITAIQEKIPAKWEKLNHLYNPEGKHDASLKEFLQKYGH
ncbi:ejaculatory bulb-specific protein 3-like [Nymphalis io]|uniref:ejaculatory bulb-specific protein 3-like n=1 Tax=Inachis io TaxID=171585 RepID=UPI00216890E7|nr:ejaculatory bulb-specific protein 3-like [Nymphalis io]